MKRKRFLVTYERVREVASDGAAERLRDATITEHRKCGDQHIEVRIYDEPWPLCGRCGKRKENVRERGKHPSLPLCDWCEKRLTSVTHVGDVFETQEGE